MSGDNILSAVVAPCTGAWIEKVEVVGGRLHTFLCERKNILFLLRVLSMYLTSYDFHLPVFRAFLPFFGGSRWKSVESFANLSQKAKISLRFIVRLPNPSYTAPAAVSHTGSADTHSD